MFSSNVTIRSLFFILTVLTVIEVYATDLSYPPKLPGGKIIVTDRSAKFLKPVSKLLPGVTIAKTAPTVDFLYYPEQTYPGEPWSVWGDSLSTDGKYYSAIGDHKKPQGNAFVYEYDPQKKTLRTIVNLKKLLGLPAGHYMPGKIHSRIDMGSDGWLYFATHRGGTRVTTDQYHYKGDWIVRHHPKKGKTEIVAHAPVPKHCIPTSVLDPERLIFYGGTAAGNRKDPVQFFSYDIRKRKVLHTAQNGPYRYLIFAKSTGRVYYVTKDGGPLMRYDPADGKPPTQIPGKIGLRAATQETADGYVYTVSTRGDGTIWRFNTKTEKIDKIGIAAVSSQDYVASLDVDPTGRYLYYVCGAHGGGQREGTPIVQFDVKTGKKKVLAFLHPYYKEKYGYTPLGTFGSAVSEDGSKLYVTWNGNRSGTDARGRLPFDTCAMTVIHIPESERQTTRAIGMKQPFIFQDVAKKAGMHDSLRGMMGHAAAWGDVDGDGWIDLFVGTFADRPAELYREGGAAGPVPNRLLLNRKGKFVHSKQKGMDHLGRASGSIFADFDNDGRLDLYVANNGRLGKENLLYHNRGGGRFENVTKKTGASLHLPETARSATVLDFDGDGLLDLLVLGTIAKSETLLFRNLGGMKFKLSTAFPRGIYGLGVAVGDLTGNGWPDVMIGGPNRLFVNMGNGKFREATELGIKTTFTREDDSPSCGVAFGDFDRDGLPDMLIGSHHKRPWKNPNSIRLYRNLGSTAKKVCFEEVTGKVGIVKYPMKIPHVEIRDFNNDGWPDLYTAVVTMRGGKVYPAIYKNLGSAKGKLPRFQETAFIHRKDFPSKDDLPPGKSKVFYDKLVANRKVMYFAPGPSGDFDNDGRLDLFLPSWWPKMPSMLLKNKTPSGNYLDVTVVGSKNVNRMGIGTVVRAYKTGSAGKQDALLASEEISTGYGFCSGQPAVAHLGLGKETSCDLVITLPHGKGRIIQKGVKVNQRLKVTIQNIMRPLGSRGYP